MSDFKEKSPTVEQSGNNLKNDDIDLDYECTLNDHDNRSNGSANSDVNSETQEQIYFGPLSKEDAERLQREANEETTNSEDLRLFLQVRKWSFVTMFELTLITLAKNLFDEFFPFLKLFFDSYF